MVSGEIHVFVLWLLDEALEISPCLYTMTDHVESDDISERDVACRGVLYTSLGLLPVGRPSTKGFSDVRAWVLIRSTDVSSTSDVQKEQRTYG